MIPVHTFSARKVAVMGLARSGLTAALSLAAGGAEVCAWDDAEERRAEAEAAGVPLTDLAELDWTGCAALVLSPGIPDQFPTPNPIAADAQIVSTSWAMSFQTFQVGQSAAVFWCGPTT